MTSTEMIQPSEEKKLKTKKGRPKSNGNGEGTIYKHTNNDTGKTTWYAQLTIGTKPDGSPKRKSFSGKSKADVKRKQEEYKEKLKNGINIAAENMKAAEWIEFWYENYKKPTIKDNTIEWYQTQIYVHLLPIIPGVKLKSITPDHIMLILNSLRDHGLSDYNIYRLYIILKAVFSQAVINRLLFWNPVDAVPKPKHTQNQKRPLTEADMDRLIDCIDINGRWGLATYLLLTTGVRIGELFALSWPNIDFDNNRLAINGTVTRIKGKGLVITPPKPGSSNAEIPISDFTVQLLKYCKVMQDDMRKKDPAFNNENQTVLCTSKGTLIDPSNYRRAFNKLKEQAGLPATATPHTLRKTFATRLLERGADLQTIKDLLRHSHIDVTTQYYAFSNSKMQAAATNDFSEALKNRTSSIKTVQ